MQPDVVVSLYPADPHLIDEMLGPDSAPKFKHVVVITDSISVNAISIRAARRQISQA